MATVMKKVDAVIVGFGWTGAIMAKELTEAGLNVLALERGPMQDTYPDGNYPQVIDELTYSVRKKLFQDISKETVTIRHSVNDIALPNRQLGAFLPGNGVGGAGLHWSGVHFRVDPIELRMRSHYEERYGKSFIPKDMTIQDFGVSYEELEPFFDFAEKVFGTSGQAWTVKGQLVGDGKLVATSLDFGNSNSISVSGGINIDLGSGRNSENGDVELSSRTRPHTSTFEVSVQATDTEKIFSKATDEDHTNPVKKNASSSTFAMTKMNEDESNPWLAATNDSNTAITEPRNKKKRKTSGFNKKGVVDVVGAVDPALLGACFRPLLIVDPVMRHRVANHLGVVTVGDDQAGAQYRAQ